MHSIGQDELLHVLSFCHFDELKCLRLVDKKALLAVHKRTLDLAEISLANLKELRQAAQDLDQAFYEGRFKLADLTLDIEPMPKSFETLKNSDFSSLLKFKSENQKLYKQVFHSVAHALTGVKFFERQLLKDKIVVSKENSSSTRQKLKLLKSVEKVVFLEGFILSFNSIPLLEDKMQIVRLDKPITPHSDRILMASIILKAAWTDPGEYYPAQFQNEDKKIISLQTLIGKTFCYLPLDQLEDVKEGDIVKFKFSNIITDTNIKIKFCQLKWSPKCRALTKQLPFEQIVNDLRLRAGLN